MTLNEEALDAAKAKFKEFGWSGMPAGFPDAITAYLAASTPAKPVGELVELIGQYWDLAYAEGKEGRDHDTPSGDAQRVLSAITSALTTLAAERDALIHDIERLHDVSSALLEDCESYKASDAENFRKYTAAQAQVATLTAALEKLVAAEDQYVAEAGMDLADPIADAVAAARAALNPKPSEPT